MFLALLVLSSCKKNDSGNGITTKEMKDLQVSSGFDWETSRDVTFLVYSDQSAVISITSEAADIQYYRGFFNGLTSNFPVTLGISDQNGNVEILSGATLGEQVVNIGLKAQ